MANYPGAIDSAASMYSPVDAFSAKPLETTTTGAVLAGDSTINVASTSGGFAATYGILSIDDELIVYTGKTGTQFTGCQRGAFGTATVGHGNGVAVKANMVAGFITALQSAVVAVETELDTAAARNYIRKDGAVTVTGLKTFQDGAEFGAGTKSSTGLVRLPNAGAVKWRKQDNSGDLGIVLNASNHLAMDAIIDFAAGQTFGASTVPDATTLAKGVVQIDPVGGINVAAGAISLSTSGVGPGTYTKLTVDAWGRATAGTTLAAGDLPAHTHVASDIVSGALPFTIQNNGAAVGTRRALNLIQGASIGLTFLDVPASDRVNVTIALGAHTHAQADVTSLTTDLAGKAPLSHTHAEADVTGLVSDLAGKAASVHSHTSSQISGATAAATASTVLLRDGDGGANFTYAAVNNLWAFEDSHLQSVECGAFGGPYENMAKYSEDFSVGTWDKNGGSCSVSANAAAAPDGNTTADQIAASTATPVVQQNVAGLVDGGTYTFYVWARVASGTKNVSVAIVNNAYGAYLAGPAQVTLTTAWQRFRITGTLAGGQTGLWIVVRQFDGNGDTSRGVALTFGTVLEHPCSSGILFQT
ncbi:MAG TPA: carbohydrate binding domain-containing protein [Bryobacteraceae bacterium]|nr:carbohydrate binding domain-containing protein [Bryobacteraceae bacterium]